MPKLTGSQEPTYSWCGEYSRTEGKFATDMAVAYGMPPHPWQATILNDWLALDEDGKLLNTLCVLPVPRQNGKTGVCDPRETWGLVYRGEQILHTAQEYQTAKKAFDRLREKFGECRNDPRAKHPELNALVKRYTTSANQMVLDLTNGGHIEFRTRGSNSDMGRGGTFDLVVIDEAQSYTDAQDAALAPLNSAAPSGSPQTILMGTVPDPSAAFKGAKFAAIRRSLHEKPYVGACIHEWGAKEIGDVEDKSRWYEFNPSLGFQLLESALEKDSRTMSPDAFAREHLGLWPQVTQNANALIKPSEWNACKNEHPKREGVLVLAVRFSADGKTGALAACYRPKDGIPFVYVIDHRSTQHGISWFSDKLTEIWHDAAAIVIDGQAYSKTLYNMLIQNKVRKRILVMPSAADATTAYSGLLNAVREKRISHYGQPALDQSATGSERRLIGKNGGWGFQSTEQADATLIESCSWALWGAMTTKRKPGRKAVVRV